jgi:hypothetical protein
MIYLEILHVYRYRDSPFSILHPNSYTQSCRCQNDFNIVFGQWGAWIIALNSSWKYTRINCAHDFDLDCRLVGKWVIRKFQFRDSERTYKYSEVFYRIVVVRFCVMYFVLLYVILCHNSSYFIFVLCYVLFLLLSPLYSISTACHYLNEGIASRTRRNFAKIRELDIRTKPVETNV